jgi:hypothetical protein
MRSHLTSFTAASASPAAGTDNQVFCYDEQDRLVWASSASGSVPCGGNLTAGAVPPANTRAWQLMATPSAPRYNLPLGPAAPRNERG